MAAVAAQQREVQRVETARKLAESKVGLWVRTCAVHGHLTRGLWGAQEAQRKDRERRDAEKDDRKKTAGKQERRRM